MQALDAITLHLLAETLNQWLAGAKVSKVQHPAAHEFLLTFWGGPPDREGRNQLYLNLHPQYSFLTLLGRKEKTDFIHTEFEKPTTFCMLLRKHLNGANLEAVYTLPGERVLNLRFDTHNELGNRVKLVLSLELMGKHSNMILYDEVQQTILGVAHGVSEAMSQYRELAPGLSYAPPPQPGDKRPLVSLTAEEFVQALRPLPPAEWPAWLIQHVQGLGKRVVEDVLHQAPDPEMLYATLLDVQLGRNLRPAISEDGKRFSLLMPLDEDDWCPLPTMEALVHDYCLTQLIGTRLETSQRELLQVLTGQERRRAKRAQELSPVSEAEVSELQHQGDLLMTAYSAQQLPPKPTQGNIEVADYLTGEACTLDIDPTLSWVENAQVYYRRAQKSKARQEAFAEQWDKLEAERQFLEEMQVWVAQAEALPELRQIRDELAEAGVLRRQKSEKTKKEELRGVKTYRSSDGYTILVGKSGQGNAELVGRLARAEDLWLHVHQMPGSHVLIKVERKDHIPDQTLLEAATLAVYYSRARESANVPVIYTEIRYVRKIPGSYPGHVNYKNEETVFITVDSALLAALESREPEAVLSEG